MDNLDRVNRVLNGIDRDKKILDEITRQRYLSKRLLAFWLLEFPNVRDVESP